MVTGITLLMSVLIGVVTATSIIKARRLGVFRRHRPAWTTASVVGLVALAYPMWLWAASIGNFPATFGPFALAIALVGNICGSKRFQGVQASDAAE